MLAITPAVSLPSSSRNDGSAIFALPTSEQRETAQYVADMILELRNMSKSLKLYTITVPLEYAYYEAFSVANKVLAPAGEIERLKELSRAAEEDVAG